MVEIIFIVTILYASFAVAVFAGNKQPPKKASTNKFQHKADVIIPFHNEKNNLERILTDLKNQSVPPETYELYFINDHSTDGGEAFVRLNTENTDNIHVLENNGTGKKYALITGYNASENAIILLTDADTEISSDWIASHLKMYDGKTDMLIGSLEMRASKNKFWHNIQVLEYKILTLITTGMASINIPIMCSAANLSFRRSALYDIEKTLKPEYRSGDDMFLLHDMKNRKKHIRSLGFSNPNVQITSEPISTFFRQRMRWAGKSKGYKDPATLFTGGLIVSMNLIILVLAVLSIFEPEWFVLFIQVFFVKTFADFIILIPALTTQTRKLLTGFLPLAIIYPFYTVIVTVLGFLSTKKNRSGLRKSGF